MSRITYQSSQVASGSNTAVVTKPVDLAVGDLMVAWGLSYADALGAPAGWATILSGSGSGSTGFASFYKIADANDVAASNFTFTGDTNTVRVGIARFTGANSVAPINASNQSVDTGSSTSGVTPTEGAMLLILGAVSNDTATKTFGSYAVVNNNPSWSEAFDNGGLLSGGIYTSIAMAYGARPESTDTGNASFTISGSGSIIDTCIQIIAIIPDPVRADVFSYTETGFNPQIPIVLNNPVSYTETVPEPSINAEVNDWSNTPQNATSWLNQDKS